MRDPPRDASPSRLTRGREAQREPQNAREPCPFSGGMPPSRGKALVESLPKPPPSQRAARSSDPFEGAFFAPGAAGQQARQLVRKVCMLRQAAKWVTLRHRFPRQRLIRPCVARSIATRASRCSSCRSGPATTSRFTGPSPARTASRRCRSSCKATLTTSRAAGSSAARCGALSPTTTPTTARDQTGGPDPDPNPWLDPDPEPAQWLDPDPDSNPGLTPRAVRDQPAQEEPGGQGEGGPLGQRGAGQG